MLGGIFVGGESSRMGGNAKGLLRGPSGQPLVVQIAERMRAAGVTPVLVGVRAEYAAIDLPALSDASVAAGASGPLGGLVGLLEEAARDGSEVAIAIACDMPWVDTSLIRRLAAAPPCAALAPRRDGRWEPLCARYSPELVLGAARARLARRELSLQALLDEVQAVALYLDARELEMLRDWDTLEDAPAHARPPVTTESEPPR